MSPQVSFCQQGAAKAATCSASRSISLTHATLHAFLIDQMIISGLLSSKPRGLPYLAVFSAMLFWTAHSHCHDDAPLSRLSFQLLTLLADATNEADAIFTASADRIAHGSSHAHLGLCSLKPNSAPTK
jgi:hypothetical protein